MTSPDRISAPLACIGLGSNIGDRAAHLRAALTAIAGLPSTDLIGSSEFIQTDPMGPVPQGPYLNAAAAVRTRLPPRQLLDSLLAIERSRGRDRSEERRWGPRTLDLDLLLFGDLVIDEPGLSVPHPGLHQRLFVLQPLSQIAPEVVVPTLGRTVSDLLSAFRAKAAQPSHP